MPTQPIMPADLANIITLHREMFGGWTMQADTSNDDAPGPAETSTDTPPADAPQEDTTDWKAQARKWEARAKENSAAAAKLAKLEDANKTELQKAADRATAAEKARDEQATELARLRLEAAIHRHAGNADPAKLLDSRTFTAAVADLDPSDSKAIKDAIAAHTKQHPETLRTVRSSGDIHNGLTGPNGAALTGVDRMAAALAANNRKRH